MIKLIVAMDPKGIIGKNNSLPWKNKEELKHFKDTTMGASILMGRKTFESLPGILPNRKHYVLSRTNNFQNVEMIKTDEKLKEVLNFYKNSEKDLFIIGGKSIYELLINYADQLIVTIMNDEYDGDTKINIDLTKYEKSLIKKTDKFKVYKYTK